MQQNPINKPGRDDGVQSNARQGVFPEPSYTVSLTGEAPLRTRKVSELAEGCLREMSAYRCGESSTDVSSVELLRRATVEGDQEAWAWLQQCLSEVVRGWLYRHPRWEAAARLDSEANYVAQAFARFWQATTQRQQVEFRTLPAALQYLRASLNGALLDTLRAYSRPREVTLPEPGDPREPGAEDSFDSGEIWELLQRMLPDSRERQLAYLLFHCGLKPREIVRSWPQKWDSIHEIYRLRRNIMERLLSHADY